MIKNICKEIVELLNGFDNNKEWQKIFKNFLYSDELKELSTLKKDIIKIYGGMGSFNDLVLHRNCEPCIKENRLLDDLA